MLRRLFAELRKLDRPGALLAGIDLKKTGAVEAARQAIGDAPDRKFFIPGAHECLSHPFAAAIVVNGINVVITGNQVALEDGLTGM